MLHPFEYCQVANVQRKSELDIDRWINMHSAGKTFDGSGKTELIIKKTMEKRVSIFVLVFGALYLTLSLFNLLEQASEERRRWRRAKAHQATLLGHGSRTTLSTPTLKQARFRPCNFPFFFEVFVTFIL